MSFPLEPFNSPFQLFETNFEIIPFRMDRSDRFTFEAAVSEVQTRRQREKTRIDVGAIELKHAQVLREDHVGQAGAMGCDDEPGFAKSRTCSVNERSSSTRLTKPYRARRPITSASLTTLRPGALRREIQIRSGPWSWVGESLERIALRVQRRASGETRLIARPGSQSLRGNEGDEQPIDLCGSPVPEDQIISA